MFGYFINFGPVPVPAQPLPEQQLHEYGITLLLYAQCDWWQQSMH